MEQDRREFAEFCAGARDDCLRIVLIGDLRDVHEAERRLAGLLPLTELR